MSEYDTNKDDIETRYEKAFSQLGCFQTEFPATAKSEMARMIEQIVRTDENLKQSISSTNQSSAIKGGFAAEEVLAETYNMDAILKGKSSYAITDKYKTEWEQAGFSHNDPVVDIAVIKKDGSAGYKAQSKFYETPESTARNMSLLKDGEVKYKDVDALIGPQEQINPQGDVVSVKEHAEAKSWAAGRKGDPIQAEASRNTANKATDRIEFDETSSKSLSRHEANEVGCDTENGRQIRKDYQNKYQTSSTIKHMKQAAKGAAAISAISSGVVNTIIYCQMAKEGKITETEAVIKIISTTASSAADSAIKASINTGIQAQIVRYGSKEITKQIAQNTLRTMARTNMITVGVVCGIDMVKDIVKLSCGKITKAQFEERSGKGVMTTTAGVVGSTAGFEIGGMLGITGAGFIGGMAGGLIAGLAMQFAIENHIETPYRELMANTASINESMSMLRQVSQEILRGQDIFTAYLIEESNLDDQSTIQYRRIAEADSKMKAAIDRL